MRSVRYFMPEGNPTLFSSISVDENMLICGGCQQEKPVSLFYVSRQFFQRIVAEPLCVECASVGKYCSTCRKYKLFSAFPTSPRTSNRGGVTAYCKPCRRKYNKKTYNPEKQRGRNLYANFKITEAEYNAMLTKQGGTCAICKEQETAHDRRGRIKPLAVDHDHKTGKIRALLCGNCNTLLGKIETNINLMETFFEYIEEYK